jgi:hypothetical protein
MPFKKHTPEEIIGKLREAEIVLAEGRQRTLAAGYRSASRPITAGARNMAV